MTAYVFDIECDNLYRDVTKIHCLSYTPVNELNVTTLYDYQDIIKFLNNAKCLIGHNIVAYDVPVLKKILGVSITAKLYDTLALSWVLEEDRPKHGLESYGADFNLPKLEIDDWQNLTKKQYTQRCERDVEINYKLWHQQIKYLKMLYAGDKSNLDRYLQYLTFKMHTAGMAEREGWYVDLDLITSSIATLEKEQQEKFTQLAEVMPIVPKYKTKTKPKVMYKKDGSLSAHGEKWLELVGDKDVDEYEVLDSMEPPNPNSDIQVKDWLFNLGWEPCTYKFVKDKKTGDERQIPQVRVKGVLTDSVLLLAEKEPAVKVLEGLTVVSHRLGFFKSLYENHEEYDTDVLGSTVHVGPLVRASVGGLTNTLRFKHSAPLANIPGVDSPWGKEIRGSLISRDGMVLCGADLVSLEATTKRHYIYPYDPDYADTLGVPGFDEHLDLALFAGYVTQQQVDDYQDGKDPGGKVKAIRKIFKMVNYSSVYGVGAAKLARQSGMSVDEAKKLLAAYWKRNWAVKKVSKSFKIKILAGQKWVFNPVSKFWYTLRHEKDVFSTVNQGTGAFIFDSWVARYTTKRPNILGQFHDESINQLPDQPEEKINHTSTLLWAINHLNSSLNLNVDLKIDIQYGYRYSEIH